MRLVGKSSGQQTRDFRHQETTREEGTWAEGLWLPRTASAGQQSSAIAGQSTKGSSHGFPDRECFLKSTAKVQTSRSALRWKRLLPLTPTARSRHGSLSRKHLAAASASPAVSSSAHIPTAHPFRTGTRKPLRSPGRIAWTSSGSHPLLLLGCQQKRWQEVSSAERPLLPRGLLCLCLVCHRHPSGQQNTSQSSASSSHLPPAARTPLPESPATLAGAWPSHCFAQVYAEALQRLPHRHSFFLSRHAQAFLQSRYSASPGSTYIRSYFCRTWPYTFTPSNGR